MSETPKHVVWGIVCLLLGIYLGDVWIGDRHVEAERKAGEVRLRDARSDAEQNSYDLVRKYLSDLCRTDDRECRSEVAGVQLDMPATYREYADRVLRSPGPAPAG